MAEIKYPDNGFIDMLWINRELDKYADMENYSIDDEEAFALIITRLELLTQRSTYDSLRTVELQKELDAIQLRYPPGFHRNIREIGMAAATILPELGKQRSLVKIIVNKAVKKVQLGERDSAAELIFLIDKFIYQLSHCKDLTLIQELVTIACAGLTAKNDDLQELFKSTPELREVHARLLALGQLKEKFKQEGKEINALLEKQTMERGGILANMVLPAIGSFHKKAPDKSLFDASRRIEYTLITKNFLLSICALMFILNIGCLVLIGALKIFSKKEKAFLLLPRMGALTKHLLLTIVLPLLLFELYKMMPFSSHAWGFRYSLFYFIAELLLICLFIPVASIVLWQRKSGRRLLHLGLQAELPKTFISKYGFIGVLCLTPLAFISSLLIAMNSSFDQMLGLSSMSQLMYMGDSPAPQNGITTLIASISMFLLFSSIIMYRFLKRSGRHYYSCLCRSLLLYCSCCLLVLSLYSAVFLRAQESHFSQKDTLLKAQASGFTSFEKEAVENIREEAHKLWNEQKP